MRISYYCQHVLGIGHFHRSLAICKSLAQKHHTTLILGGPEIEVEAAELQVIQLPGLMMDERFTGLRPCDPSRSLEAIKHERQQKLYQHIATAAPEIFITELYPFGRKAFRFELDPILKGIQQKQLPPSICLCSVRDILVEKKEGTKKFEERVIDTVNRYYDGILVHADQSLISLAETFPRLNEIHRPCHYTGFVCKANERSISPQAIREGLALRPDTKLVVASIGGGNVGRVLLENSIKAVKLLETKGDFHLQVFCGPFSEERWFKDLQCSSNKNLSVDRFTQHFPSWLEAADLSLSMAGYNTTMDLAQAGVPGLVYPFPQNQEQELRAQRFSTSIPIAPLEDADLKPEKLAQRILLQLQAPRKRPTLNLDGATQTGKILEDLAQGLGNNSSHQNSHG